LLAATLLTGCATAPLAPRFAAPAWAPADETPAGESSSLQSWSSEVDAHASFDSPPGPVDAAPSASADFIRPYFWMAGINGTVTAHGVSADVDESFSDIYHMLDFGFMLAYEHRFEDGNSLLMDSLYTKLDADAKVAGVEVDSTLKMAYLEVSGAFPVEGSDGVDAIAGVRGWYTSANVDVTGFGSGDQSVQWLDPIVGARWGIPLDDKWSMHLRGDIGGFGIGSASDFTWQGQAIAAYQLSEAATLGFGYRYLSVDRKQGSGAGETKADLALSGFLVGLDYRF
jgi:opacity protein-like surface antigen